MTAALLAESEIRQLPRAEVAPPTSLDQMLETTSPDKVTPLHEALGLPSDETPSGVLQARQLAARHPDSAVAYARLAQAEISVGNVDEARDAALKALEHGRDHTYFAAARSAAAGVLARVDQDLSDAAYETIDDPIARISWAGEAARSGSYAVALERLGDLASPAAFALRGYCYVKSGAHANAIASYRAARKSGVESVEVLINLGYALASLGAFRKAIATTSLATHLAPKNKVAAYNLIRYLSHERDNVRVLAEFDRVAMERPWDLQVALARAWGHAGAKSGNKQAVRILREAKKSAEEQESPLLPDINASFAYMKKATGLLDASKARQEMWAALRASDYTSEEIVRMLLASMNHGRELSEAQMLEAETQDRLSIPLALLVRSKVAFLAGDPVSAADLAEQAASADPENEHGTVAVAAYLVGEVRGEYARAVQIARPSYEDAPSADVVNNLAFSLALSGDHEAALTLLNQYSLEELPFHGATKGLGLLCAGRIEEGLEIYTLAEKKLREDGDSVTADCVATRAGLALRELGLVDHPRASEGELLKTWPKDSRDPRVPALVCVAERTGLSAFAV